MESHVLRQRPATLQKKLALHILKSAKHLEFSACSIVQADLYVSLAQLKARRGWHASAAVLLQGAFGKR